MDTLSDEVWDVLIAGTSLPESLLALSLSRSGKKVLHVDRHRYYGGEDAALSLQDAEDWAQELQQSPSQVFRHASIVKPPDLTGALATSRSYTLSLNPQIIYAKSEFLPTLVSSRIHTQLEFLAVGSWWVLRNETLHKIPSTREDVFNDESLSMKDKRGLMKFLRYVLQEDEDTAASSADDDATMSLKEAVTTKFKIPESLQAPLLALALSPVAADSIPFDKALARIRRHMRSMGYFGPGFGAVIPKYGGNSEISQVACRAQAVGGGVYLLGQGLKSRPELRSDGDTTWVESTLSDGTQIRSHHLAIAPDDIPSAESSEDLKSSSNTWRSINVVANPLSSLFPPTSDGGPNPAVAIVLVEDSATGPTNNPVYLQIHSEDTGECPAGQCIIYASVTSEDQGSKGRLQDASSAFLQALDIAGSVLWSMSFRISGPSANNMHLPPSEEALSSKLLRFESRPHDITLDDSVLDRVKDAWEAILGAGVAADSTFMRFEERESELED
ncbi:Rab proteins geranylgeranyltransferase component A [Cladophialophora chaetospira]|uniref:Rab proteins geranylgeranyltransferase n=1 Tax=Cladophialophora chaetospira TaxID=386627 RepID=A0AA38XF18_9EURO|nr:Rab proteins geranylgeranyltransferase component A [Cladophialophora chaetospira]